MRTEEFQRTPSAPGYREIFKLAWPLALGMANNALMQFVDRVFLARESASSLEAALPASILAYLFIGFFQNIVAYSGIFVAQFHGAGNERGCAQSCRAGLALALASTIFLVALIPVGNAIFDWCGHAPAVLAREKSYYSIVMAGGMLLCGSMALQGYFTGLGLTRVVFWVNLAGNLLNIALDPLLIFGCEPFPAMGIAGAAVATVFSQFVQFAALGLLAWRRLRAMPGTAAAMPETAFGALLVRVLRFGLPAGIYSLLNLLSFTAFVFVTGKVGDMEFAVSNAAFTVNYLLFAPIEGFSIGAGTLVGQFQGRGDSEGAFRAGRRSLALAELYVVVTSTLVVLCHRPILGLFVASNAVFDPQAFISLGFTLFVMMALWQFFDGGDIVLAGALKGAGDTRFVMVWMLVCSFLVWLPLVWIVYQRYPTMPALWSTMIVYVVLICIGTAIRWWRGGWTRIRLVEKG